MRLYSGPLSMFGAKVQIAALEKRLGDPSGAPSNGGGG